MKTPTTEELSPGKVLTKEQYDNIVRIKPNSSSIAWCRFSLVKDNDLAVCDSCYKTYYYHSKKSGTSSLLSHKCCLLNTPSVLSHIHNSKLSKANKTKLNDIIFNFLVQCWLPLRIVETDGFKQFIKDITLLSYKNHVVVANDSIMHRTSFSNMILSLYKKEKEKYKNELKTISKYSLYLDLWTQKTTKQKYLSIFIGYLDNNLKFKTKNLSTHFIGIASKVQVNKDTQDVLAEFGLNTDNLTSVVTDAGTNVTKLFENKLTIVCFAHRINTVLSNLFEDAGQEVSVLLKTCSSLSQMSKYSKFHESVGVKLPSLSNTRWNSQYMLLEAVHTHISGIKEYLRSEKHFNMIENLKEILILKLIIFLKPFFVATKELEKKDFTLYLIQPLRHTLTQHINDSMKETNTTISRLATKTKTIFRSKMEIYDEHSFDLLLSTFLNPEFSGLNWVPSFSRHVFIRDVTNMITNDLERNEEVQNTEEIEMVEDPDSQVLLNRRENTDVLNFKRLKNVRTPQRNLNEVTEYLSLCRTVPEPLLNNCSEFWKIHKSTLPRLCSLFMEKGHIMGSSCVAEGHFSKLGYYINARKANLNTEKLRAYAFLNGS